MKNRNIFCLRRFAAAIALLTLACGSPSRAWCGGSTLWVSLDGVAPGIASYTSKQLKKSGMPTPRALSTYDQVSGLAFDKSHNLWAVIHFDEVVKFTAAQLKNLYTNRTRRPQ